MALLSGLRSVRAEDPPTPSAKVLQLQADRIAAIEKATQSTIGVFGTDGQGGGSGVIISEDGYALTNFHVTQPFGDRMRAGLSRGEMVDAIIVGIDPTGDLALIKLLGRDSFPAATIADSDTVKAGHWCFAAGNPFVLATNLRPTVTWGIVSGVNRYQYPSGTILEYTDCIQTDAAINPGNSGGPLYNAEGDLIGINGRCSFEKRGRVNVGVGYAISINQAMLFLGHLKSGRIVDHATLNFTVSTDAGKVVVSNILDSSDAYRRGIRYGDEIVRLAGREVTTVNQLKNILGIFPSHSRLQLHYRRDGELFDTWVRVTPLHTIDELEEIAGGEMMGKPPTDEEPEKSKKESDAMPEDKDPFEGLLEKRRGFANYFFNRSEIDRIQSLATKHSKPDVEPKISFDWRWKGKFAGETTAIELESSEDKLRSVIGGEPKMIDRQIGWNGVVREQSFHAIGIGLRLWRAWHHTGPRNLGEAIYIGTTTCPSYDGMLDMTQVTVGEIEAFFYTRPEDGRLQRLEMECEKDTDRFEMEFAEYGLEGFPNEPRLIRAGVGVELDWVVELEKVEFISPEAKSL